MTITVCIPFSIKFIAVVFESGMFRWITHCYEFLVSNVSILLFAHGKIADANYPPVVSPADLKCKFTSYNKNTPNMSPQKSPVKNISPGAYFRNFTASNSNIQKGCPIKTRKPGKPIVKAPTSHDILLNLVY